MNWDEIKSAVMAFFERFSQTCLYQQQTALKPIPIDSQQPHRQPKQR